MLNYQQTLDYLFSQLPMFQRIGAAAYKADLTNTIAICKLLGNPENKFKSIHIAGTNGKGSTSHYLASVLQSAGYKVGLYTSPHLKDFRERIKINGNMIPEQFVIDFVEKYKTDFEKIQPSFFEMTVGLAFEYFASQQVDIAIIETGLGGRLDSTNVIQPLLSIITNISIDHVMFLGNTLEKIAEEKAGIIKPKTPIIIGETTNETKAVFLKKAKEQAAPILFADSIFKIKNIHQMNAGRLLLNMDVEKNGQLLYIDLKSELLGLYQQKNIPTVLLAIEQLIAVGFIITKEQQIEGIEYVVRNTGLMGRWQVISLQPLVIADTGHNEAGINEVVAQLQQTPHKHLHFVLGMVNDKDISAVLSLLPKTATYYYCRANIPRAMDASLLKNLAQKRGLNGTIYSTVLSALDAAKTNAQQGDLIIIAGSTFTVAEVL